MTLIQVCRAASRAFSQDPRPGLQGTGSSASFGGRSSAGVSSFSKRAFLSMTRSRRPILLFARWLSAAPSFFFVVLLSAAPSAVHGVVI